MEEAQMTSPRAVWSCFYLGKCSQKGHQRELSPEASERSVFRTGPRPIEASMVHCANSVAKHSAATSKAAGYDENLPLPP